MYLYCVASGFVLGPEYVALCWQKIFSITSEFIKFGCIGCSSQYISHRRLNPLIQYMISVKHSLVMKLFCPFVFCFSQKLHQFSKNWRQDSRVARRSSCVDVMERGLRNISISLDVWFKSSIQGFKMFPSGNDLAYCCISNSLSELRTCSAKWLRIFRALFR